MAADFTVGGWWGGPSVESPAPARAANLGDAFGAAGHLVLTTATDASVWSQSYSKSKGSSTNVNLEPSLDYFATENVSIGVDAFIAYQQGTSLDSSQATTNFSATSIGFAPRIGANIPATAALSVWPQIELGYGTVSTNETSVNGTNQHTRKLSWVELSAPVLVHPASHFFVGAGPYVFHELSDADQHDYENDATTLGAKLVLGGWL